MSSFIPARGEAWPIIKINYFKRSIRSYNTVSTIYRYLEYICSLVTDFFHFIYVETVTLYRAVLFFQSELGLTKIGIVPREEWSTKYTIELHQVSLEMFRYYRTFYSSSTESGIYELNVDADMTLVIVLKGDVKMDGAISGKDSTLLKQHIVGSANPALNDLQLFAAETVDYSGISAKDATKIAQVVVGNGAFEW